MSIIATPAFYENPIEWVRRTAADLLASIHLGDPRQPGILESDYLRIKQELILGMKRAGAKQWQIDAALAEYERIVAASGGVRTVSRAVAGIISGVSKLAWVVVVIVGGYFLIQARQK